ncbi:hypothetical protein AVV40_gp13 [Mycobacterium phage Swirley]|uniref:Uncharacterized protein n=1 Tax=Mycobacterium phage Swirley TaxID=1527534 RepID=A0A076YJS4_9CAUD|nr:hypothetical protein AVV40_gp13 [Mycobacterium phage Swirley]AIK68946.1 hypothetical protein PBI_SWIRLEY_81 [Mycobacterium phage Swirley]
MVGTRVRDEYGYRGVIIRAPSPGVVLVLWDNSDFSTWELSNDLTEE